MAKPSLNWLLVFLPMAVVLEIAHARYHAAWATPTWIFLCSAAAVIPVAGWMGRATEYLASRLGEGIGGLLNATFGNAAELIIAAMALLAAARDPAKQAAMHGIVKASLTGSIIGNVLLVLGVALLAGGVRYKTQRFNATAARVGATLLTLAVVALLIPALFAYFAPERRVIVQELSVEISLLLLLAYAMSLVFTLHTHKHLYVGAKHAGDEKLADMGHETWPVRRALGVLTLATAGVALLAEFMVGSVDEASEAMGLTELFVGMIVVAIVGNAAEHSTAVLVAWGNRMDLSLTIATGSSIQIALFVAPVLVLLSHLLGAPMDFVFTVPEIVATGIAVAVAGQIAGDGESNWLEGTLLLTVYVMLGVLFYHLGND